VSDNLKTCTCDPEVEFQALRADASDDWEVFDAECVVAATCKEERFARLIAWSLNHTGEKDTTGRDSVCRTHWCVE
jgi:hypothetical protein